MSTNAQQNVIHAANSSDAIRHSRAVSTYGDRFAANRETASGRSGTVEAGCLLAISVLRCLSAALGLATDAQNCLSGHLRHGDPCCELLERFGLLFGRQCRRTSERAFPSARARARPACVRSIMRSRSNSATAPSTPIVIFPAVLLVKVDAAEREAVNPNPPTGGLVLI